MVMVKRKFAVINYTESECEAFLNFFIGFSCPKAIFCGQKKVFESALMNIHTHACLRITLVLSYHPFNVNWRLKKRPKEGNDYAVLRCGVVGSREGTFVNRMYSATGQNKKH